MIEGVLLTGGASTRMGADKASLIVNGESLAERAVRALSLKCSKLTILGPSPVLGVQNQADEDAYAGPLVALAGFEPSLEFVFVLACDMPLFEPRVVDELSSAIGGSDAAVPLVDGRHHPLCALYRRSAFEVARSLVADGNRRMMAWIEQLGCVFIGLDSNVVKNLNSPSDVESLGAE